MKILVVGAGMYVTGRGGTGIGTVLCSIAETSRTLPIEEVTVVARASENRAVVDEAAERINRTLVHLPPGRLRAGRGRKPGGYRGALP